MVNKSDPISDKLERVSKFVFEEMKVGEFINPTELFRKKAKGINPTTGNGWFEIRDSLNEIPIKRLENKGKTTGYIKVDEEDNDVLGLILKKLKKIESDVEELKKRNVKK